MFDDLKRILKSSSIYSLGEIFKKLVGFVMIPVYTRYLTTADYGILEVVTLVSTVFSMVLCMNLTSGMVRYYYEYKEEEEKKRLVSTVLIFIIVVSALAACTLLFFSKITSLLLFRNEHNDKFFHLVFIAMAFEMCSGVGFTYLRVRDKAVFYISVSIIQLLISLALNIYFIVILQLGLISVLYSMLISQAAVGVFFIAYLVYRSGIHFDSLKFHHLLKFSLPIIPATFFMFILNMGDRFLLNHLAGEDQVGIYSLGYKFGMLLGTFIGGPFLMVWSPKKVQIFKTREDWGEITAKVTDYILFLLLFSGLAISALINEILIVMTTPAFYPAGNVVPLIVLGYVFYIINLIFDIGIFIKKKTFWYPIINGSAALINILLNLILIPKLGYLGAGISTTLSFLCCPIITYLISQKYVPVKYNFLRMAKLLLIAIVLFAISKYASLGNIFLNILLKMMIVLLYPFLLFVMNFFDDKEMSAIWNLWHFVVPKRANKVP